MPQAREVIARGRNKRAAPIGPPGYEAKEERVMGPPLHRRHGAVSAPRTRLAPELPGPRVGEVAPSSVGSDRPADPAVLEGAVKLLEPDTGPKRDRSRRRSSGADLGEVPSRGASVPVRERAFSSLSRVDTPVHREPPVDGVILRPPLG